MIRPPDPHGKLRVSALFAGIGGIELGLERAGHETTLLCEIDEGACAVLATRFPGVRLERDVREIDDLPAGTDLLTAGFPCQDLSQAGGTKGISGAKSGLVDEVFRLVEKRRVPWILLENVPFMLHLNRGAGIAWLVGNLERLGYRWAYRVVDSRCFGLPQRRQRVYLLASTEIDPAGILLSEDAGVPDSADPEGKACGFYWTEGLRGLGWAVDGVPTLKGGSTVGIPSPPAIWLPTGRIVTPEIRDAERLQGFPADWTKPAANAGRGTHRWKLVGNAVNVAASTWIGEKLAERTDGRFLPGSRLGRSGTWPKAAHGGRGQAYSSEVSPWPVHRPCPPLGEFLEHEPKLLSARATRGFLGRLDRSNLRFPPEFRSALESHIEAMEWRLRVSG